MATINRFTRALALPVAACGARAWERAPRIVL